jgi:hypothetical protein
VAQRGLRWEPNKYDGAGIDANIEAATIAGLGLDFIDHAPCESCGTINQPNNINLSSGVH